MTYRFADQRISAPRQKPDSILVGRTRVLLCRGLYWCLTLAFISLTRPLMGLRIDTDPR